MTARIHFIRDGRFVCTAEPTAPCRNYPSCECEEWTLEEHGQRQGQRIGMKNGRPLFADFDVPPMPGHESVPQEECWVEPWLTATDLRDTYGAAELYIDDDEFPDGPVDIEWHGDCVTWEYADHRIVPPGQRVAS